MRWHDNGADDDEDDSTDLLGLSLIQDAGGRRSISSWDVETTRDSLHAMSLQQLRGFIDYRLGLKRHFYPWGFAMNGMTSRLEAVRQIIFNLKIEQIIETGTLRGTTAEWFAQFGIPVETVEIVERYYSFSKERLKPFSNAKIYLNSSIDFLKDRISKEPANSESRQLFYLDSHWERYLPLREEIELIFNHYGNSLAVIDDFEVPDDPGYRFDAYSDEDQLTVAYLAKARVPRPLLYRYPSTKSSDETGARRGWVVVTDDQEIADELDRIPLLRKSSPPIS